MRRQKEIKWKLINDTKIFDQNPFIIVENKYSQRYSITAILLIQTNPIIQDYLLRKNFL